MSEDRALAPGSPARLALVWGSLWGAALGLVFLGPAVTATRHFDVEIWWQWGVVAAYLALLFALLGGVLGLFGCLPLALWFRIRPPRDLDRALALGALGILPILYCAVGWVCQEATPGPKNTISRYPADAHAMVLTSIAWAGVVGFVGSWRHAVSSRAIARAAVLAMVLGAAAIPFHGVRGEIASRPAVPAVPRRLKTRPLLFVGLDGASWKTLRPLLDRGALPTFAALAERGIRGEVAAIWPPFWSAAAWAAIVSGKDREETQIYEDLAEHPPWPMPEFQINLTSSFELDPVTVTELIASGFCGARLGKPSRHALHAVPFWEIANHAGVNAAVVRMPFTDPAAGQARTIISDAAGQDEWSLIGSMPRVGPGLAWPPARERALLAPFRTDAESVTLSSFVPNPKRPKPADARVDSFRVLEISLRIDQQTLRAAAAILRDDPSVELLALYLGGLDEVGHAFFQYRFPNEFPASPPAAEDVAELGSTIDRYWQFLDGELGRLLQGFPNSPNVIVTADHGMEATHEIAVWKGWHSRRGGVVIASGPDIPRSDRSLSVSYRDIAPTVLDLLGVSSPAQLDGTSLLRAR